MRRAFVWLVVAVLADLRPAAYAQKSGANSAVHSLLDVTRIYVAQLTGGVQADAMRDLLIASIESTKLFVLTDNEARADAILKGAGDDQTFTDTFDSDAGVTARQNGGKSSGLSAARSGGIYGGLSVGDNEAHHIKQRKHEAYAAVRLCNKDGDVLWSTTQESLGAKFHGANADVAAKVARQLTFDVEKLRKTDSMPARQHAN
jgi:hypothetical protein